MFGRVNLKMGQRTGWVARERLGRGRGPRGEYPGHVISVSSNILLEHIQQPKTAVHARFMFMYG